MDWDKLKIFHNVALDLNISEAAHKMNISHSSISRQISSLERELKVSLFKRHARGLTLTEQGKILFKTAHDIFGKIALTEAQLTESKEKPTGSLTIAATVAFGTTWLAPRIVKFSNSYPYIEKFGIPNDVSELSKHKIIAFGHDVEPSIPDVNCILDLIPKNKKVKTLFISNMYGVMRAIGGGAGIGALPEYMKSSKNNLVPILPDAKTPKAVIYFTYPPELKGSKKIEALRDFLVREVNKERKD